MVSRSAEIEALEAEILEKKKELAELRRAHRERVEDFVLETPEGSKRISELFGDKDELVVVHNMGRGCNHCSLWADGFRGFTQHFLTRAGFVLVSADPIDRLMETAERRGWNFPLGADADGAFRRAMNMDKDGDPWPGISAFVKEGGEIYRYGYAYLGEGDDFCSIWHVWDLFPTGWNDWSPK